jgi:hypothetical protein
MSADPDRALLAGAAVMGSAVAIREDLPGQPCGISIPLSVPAGLLADWGAGVAAPWPMPAAAVIAAARSQRTLGSASDPAVDLKARHGQADDQDTAAHCRKRPKERCSRADYPILRASVEGRRGSRSHAERRISRAL